MQVVVSDLLTNYDISGKGKTLLLIHGWADSLHTYDLLATDLSNEYQIVRLDLPGFGQSQAPKSIWGMDEYCKFVQYFLAKLKMTELYAVIGHSNGGALAIRAVSKGNLQPDKLVLLAASGVRNTKKLQKAGLKVVAKTGKAMTFWLPLSTRQKLQKKLYGAAGSDMLVAPHLQETFKMTVKQDIQIDAQKLQTPTLLIYGSKDKATPLKSIGERLQQRITASKLITIDGADHFVHQSHHEQVSRDIVEFLK